MAGDQHARVITPEGFSIDMTEEKVEGKSFMANSWDGCPCLNNAPFIGSGATDHQS